MDIKPIYLIYRTVGSTTIDIESRMLKDGSVTLLNVFREALDGSAVAKSLKSIFQPEELISHMKRRKSQATLSSI